LTTSVNDIYVMTKINAHTASQDDSEVRPSLLTMIIRLNS